jgi:hypothetical protein
MIRSVPPAQSARAIAVLGSRDALAQVGRSFVGEPLHGGVRDALHLVQQHLRRRRPDEVVRAGGEALDERGTRRRSGSVSTIGIGGPARAAR